MRKLFWLLLLACLLSVVITGSSWASEGVGTSPPITTKTLGSAWYNQK